MALKTPDDTVRGIGNCGIVAVAMLAGVTYREACKALKRDGTAPDTGKRAAKRYYGTYHWDRIAALEDLGKQPIDKNMYERHSIRTWAKKLRPDTTFMVRISGHVVTMRGGLIWDQGTEGVPVAKYRKGGSMVKSITHLA
jgi:hypothetical protein